MHRYASSKFRILLFAVLTGVLIAAVAPGFGQSTQPASGAAETVVRPRGAFGLVIENLDFVFIIIALLSITGLTLIIQGAIKNRRSVFMPEATTNRIRELIAAGQYKELLQYTEEDPTFVSKAMNAALKRAPSFEAMREAMETSVGEQTADQFRRIEYLNIIGNLGPLLGLLGTVLGMIEAFQAMNAAGGAASPGQLAGGISKALAHTMLGLLLAVPCLAAFGVLRTIVDRLTVQGALVAEELLLMIRPAGAPQAAAQAAPPRTVAPTAPPMTPQQRAPVGPPMPSPFIQK